MMRPTSLAGGITVIAEKQQTATRLMNALKRQVINAAFIWLTQRVCNKSRVALRVASVLARAGLLAANLRSTAGSCSV